MATYTNVVRRGLPRTPGGEPWPETDALAPIELPEPAAAAPLAPATPAGAVAMGQTDAPAAAQAIDASSAGSHAVPAAAAVAAAPVANDAAPVAGAPVSVRRGLPRVPGGEPWPPAEFAAVGAVVAAGKRVDATTVASTFDVAPAAARGEAAATLSAPETSGAVAGDSTAHDATAPVRATSDTVDYDDATVRRGLPRVAGGEPWPPADFVGRLARPAAAATPGAAEPAAAAAAEPVVAPETPAAAAMAAQPDASVAAAPSASAAPAPAAASAPAAKPATATPTTAKPTTAKPAATAKPAETAKPAREPRRIGRYTLAGWAWRVVGGLVALAFFVALVVLAARGLTTFQGVRDFMATYPGEYHLPESAPVGLPAWIGWQHFFNVFLMVLIIRSGWQIRNQAKPPAFWTPKWSGGKKISLTIWFHQSLDVLWVVNGVIFVVLLFVTGQWMRLVPTSWEVFPNAISAGIQYLTLDWPLDNGWVNYNGLQQLAYFTTVFIAAPLAALTGVRMSGVWPTNTTKLNKLYPIELARAIHFPVMLYFVAFIVVHVALVFATGALRNLNHMYAAQGSTDPNAFADNWLGFWIFVASLAVIVGAWFAARPLVLAPIASRFGTVSSR